MALRYYRTFVDQYRGDPALQVELAKAYRRVGEITSEIGSKEQALEARRQEMALWAKLAAASPATGRRNSAWPGATSTSATCSAARRTLQAVAS